MTGTPDTPGSAIEDRGDRARTMQVRRHVRFGWAQLFAFLLLGLVNIALAATLSAMPQIDARVLRVASPLLLAASLLMPTGFLLGGLVTYGGDPGIGVFLVAPGAALLALAVAFVSWSTFRNRSED